MKRKALLLLVALFAITLCYSQDVITTKTGDDIQAKVMEVGNTEIKFKRMDNLDGPLFTLLKADVLMIRYANGTKDIFTQEAKKGLNAPEFSTEDYFRQGQLDAKTHYTMYKPASSGTLLTTIILSPIIGLVPAFITSNTPPEDINLGYPNKELMQNPEYYNGYTQNAMKIKSRKVWTNWGIGIGVNLAVYVFLLNAY